MRALMMNVLKQPDARDWTSLPYDEADYTAGLNDGIAGLKIAYSPTLGYAKVHPEVAAAVEAAVQQLQALGAHVEQLDPGFEDPLGHHHRHVVLGHVDGMERADAGAAQPARPRLCRPGAHGRKDHRPWTCSAWPCAVAPWARTCASSCSTGICW